MTVSAPHALILAAGASRRFGQPKQLLDIDGEFLIRRVVRHARKACGDRVSIVLGANQDLVEPVLADHSVNIVTASNWRRGLAASLRAGIESLAPDCCAVLILLGDQSEVTADSLAKLLAGWEDNQDAIIASTYNDAIGVPAIFPARVFPRLLSLKGDKGAKSIIGQDGNVVTVPMPEAALDVDTRGDMSRPNQ